MSAPEDAQPMQSGPAAARPEATEPSPSWHGPRKADFGDIRDKERKIRLGSEHVARLDMKRKPIPPDLAKLRQRRAERLQTMDAVRVRIAPAPEGDDNGFTFLVQRQIERLAQRAVAHS